jgi:polyisoprenyl-phosphate glycosyltransferase
MSRPLLSLVIPVYNEAAQIAATVAAIRAVLAPGGWPLQFLLIDDGSTDGTWEAIRSLEVSSSDVRGVRLSRNFGKEAALSAGLDRAEGAAVITLDSDLQHPPEVIPEMLRLWSEEGFPIVDAVKRRRGTESWLHRVGARGFYGLLRRLSQLDLRQASDFKLLDARIVAVWRLMRERETFYRGLTAWVGFRHGRVFFDVAPRAQGASKWPRLRLVRYAFSAILSFSALPMQVVTTLGLLFLAFALPLGAQTLYNKFFGHASDGFATVITLLLIVGSVLMISLGIIGSYIARIFDEVKRRPRYVVDETPPPARPQS